MSASRLSGWGVILFAVAAAAARVGSRHDLRSLWAVQAQPLAADSSLPQHPRQPPPVVVARGRLRPAGGVICVAGPTRPGEVIAELKVREGEWVEAGAILAVLEGTPAQSARVQRLTAEARHATADYDRIQRLHQEAIVSTAERDAVALRAEVARADLARARADLDASNVRAPMAGRVLAIHTRPGERIAATGILDLGNTAQMEVVAEVYETDIAAVRIGQGASINAAVFSERLTGRVDRVGLTIGKQSVFDVDPAANTDARVVEVYIRLDASERVTTLTNLQVDVELAS